MRILIVDTETTGFKYTDRVVEIAAALYDVRLKTVLWQFSSLVYGPPDNAAASINGIDPEALPLAKDFYDPCEETLHYAELADALVAHNAEFDKRMIGCRLPTTKPWVCSQRQLKFPRASKSKKLIHLAVDHGILAVGAHRALGDVLMLVALFRQTPDLEDQVLAAIKVPLVESPDSNSPKVAGMET